MITLTLIQVRTELWNNLQGLQSNWTTGISALDQYINRAARDRGVTLPTTDSSEIRIIPILSEIYALEFLYNRALNNVEVTMGGKTLKLNEIINNIKMKLDRLYKLLNELESGEIMSTGAIAGTAVMEYVPNVNKQKVDVRRTEFFGQNNADKSLI